MSGNLISLAAETLVAVLLVITIVYCIMLNSRLKRLRADESDLRETISELVTATEIAERAIGGLKAAALDCDRSLASRIREAEHFSIEIAGEIAEGQKVLSRIKQIASAVRKSDAQVMSSERVDEAVTKATEANLNPSVSISTTNTGEVTSSSVTIAVDAINIRPAVKVAPARSTSRIEELKVMAEQARERLKELRKVSTERAA